MRDTLHDYLRERPSGATPRELLDLVFTRPAVDAEFGPRFLHTLLDGDARFAFASDTGRWIATAHAALAQAVDGATFVIVDLETTGGAPQRGHGIIEIGALKVTGGRIVDRFVQLVDPGRRLPPFITALTGITEVVLAGAPRIEAVLPRFIDFAADAVLVAHNAVFDLAFLSAARSALDGGRFDQPHLCTVRLARRLLPQLRRRSLDALAGHCGIALADRHRALGDARITVEVFFHLLELARRRGIMRLGELLDLQYSASDGRRFVSRLPRVRVSALPEAPGIYRLLGDGRRLLYIGKARNLRRRVGSYLTNAAAHRGKVLDLMRHARDVEVEVAGSELEAALCEADAIRQHRPPYNRLGKHLPQIAFLKLTASDPFPRLVVVKQLRGQRARYFGPFRSRATAAAAQGLLSRLFGLRTCAGRLRPDAAGAACLQGQIGACSAPCVARLDRPAYAERVAAAARFFDGETAAIERQLACRRDGHSAAQRFEAAARAQRDLDLVHRLRRRQRTLAWIVERQHFAVLQPASDGPYALLYGVVHGRLVARAKVRQPTDLADAAATLQAELLSTEPRALRPEDVDGTVILAAWLRGRGDHDGYVFALREDAPVSEQLPAWATCLSDVLARDRSVAAVSRRLSPGSHPAP